MYTNLKQSVVYKAETHLSSPSIMYVNGIEVHRTTRLVPMGHHTVLQSEWSLAPLSIQSSVILNAGKSSLPKIWPFEHFLDNKPYLYFGGLNKCLLVWLQRCVKTLIRAVAVDCEVCIGFINNTDKERVDMFMYWYTGRSVLFASWYNCLSTSPIYDQTLIIWIRPTFNWNVVISCC